MPLRLRPAAEADLDAIAVIAAAAFHSNTNAISQRLFPPHLHPANTASEIMEIGKKGNQAPGQAYRYISCN